MKIFTFSIISNTFAEYADKLPYVSAVVEDEEGNRMPAFIDNYQAGMEVKIGQTVIDCGKNEKGVQICRLP